MPTSERDTPRAILMVLDSVGAGALPDAADYGDEGSNTLANTARAVGGLALPNLQRMGLGNVTDILGVPPTDAPEASWGRCRERSAGKDTTTGHWEMMGLVLERAFPTYPDGFPPDVIEEFVRRTGVPGVLGNKAASGTVIIQEYGDEHVETGKPIVYTSADSVFQVAAHEEAFGLDRLYEVCEIARGMLTGDHCVGRVIARPFVGPDESGRYVRTHRRRDYAVKPFEKTVLDILRDNGHAVFGVGKIGDIFAWQGVDSSPHVTDNMDAVNKLLDEIRRPEDGFVFANLVDFDMLWGHRNDAQAYARGLEAVDARIPEILDAMAPGDLLIITADHGCDPTTPSTDHSREHAPLIAKIKGVDSGRDLGTRSTFADVGETVLDFYGLAGACGRGTSFLDEVRGAAS
ncbi:MAG: phosphopentomutase [Anaerosomatales bacterium]|nr:phosphopentomutase [Anaerosomatales bacterium]GAV31199.1 phosphodeoxyribomutase [Coriobacteriaceae bacterium EMTCatB1]